MDHRTRQDVRNPLKFLPFAALLLLAMAALAGCAIGPVDLGGGTPVPTVPPTDTVPPPTSTPEPRALNGRVEDAYTGKPIAGAEVTAGGVLTATNADGRYYFDDVPQAGKITITAEGYRGLEMDTGVVNQLDVKLRPSSVSGRVTDGSTGKPLAGVLVKLVLPAAPITPTTSITPTDAITATAVPTGTVPNTSTMGFGKGLSAPLQASLVLTAPIQPTTTVRATATKSGPSSTPLPPTATPTPTPVPPTGAGFIALYTDEDGNYFFKDVPEGASLSFKMPGYKLTKMPIEDASRKDVALEVFKVEAIYVTANYAASPDLLGELLDFVADDTRINAVVLNVQNDASEWVYDTQNPEVLEAENTDKFLTEMPELVKSLQARGLYVIARVVTFQQKTMAEAKPEWAVLSENGGPWKGGYAGHQKWLDASNPAAQDHMIDMTKEVIALGFDEVQYDYVRFPSDPAAGESDPVFSKPITDTGKVASLQQFLKKAHAVTEASDAFMSIDVFGYTLWPDQEDGPILGVIGQVLEHLVDYTDYVCPMIYPSHFSPGEQGCKVPAACAYELVQKSGEFAAERFEGKRAKYRPWLQDFDWDPVDYTSRGTTKVTDQYRACQETNCWGMQWWDPANNYEPRAAFKK